MGRRSGGGGGNAWNDFQQAHGGQGLSRGEMSAMYHANASSSVSAGYSHQPTHATRATSAWNEFQHDYGRRGLSRQDMKLLYAHQKGEAPAPAPVTTAGSTKTWNEFQHEYAGTGLSREQVAHLYYTQKPQTPQETVAAAPPAPFQPRHDPNRGYYSPFMSPAPSQTPLSPTKPQPKADPIGYFSRLSAPAFSFGVPAQPVSPFSFGVKNETQGSQQPSTGVSFGAAARTPSVEAYRSVFGLQSWGFSALSTAQGAFAAGFTTANTANTAVPNAVFQYEEPQEIPVYLPFAVDSRGRDRSPEELAFKNYRRRHAKTKSVASAKAISASASAPSRVQQNPKATAPTKQSGASETKHKLMLSTVKEEDEDESGESQIKPRTELEPMTNAEVSTETPQQPREKGVAVQPSASDDEPPVLEAKEIKDEPQATSEPQVEVEPQVKVGPQDTEKRPVAAESQQGAGSKTPSTPELVLDDVNAHRIGNGATDPTVKASLDGGSTQVAIKILPGLKGKRALNRHSMETEALLKLPAHQNLVQCHSVVALDARNKVGVVSELIPDCQNLVTRLYANGSTGISERAKHQLILQLLDALGHLHSHDITHRDLNPTHVLVSSGQNDSLTLKLIDFGLPTLKNAAATALSRGAITGFHPAYASPELLGGQIARDDAEAWMKSDIYSFAVVMMEILLEDEPWEGELPVFFMKAVAEQGERPFDTDELLLHGRKSRVLERVVAQAWHQDPDKRPSPSVLREMLTRVFCLEDQDAKTPKMTDDADEASVA